MKNWILKSNRWYDNLPEPKRTLFFLIVILGSLALFQFVFYLLKHETIYGFLLWVMIFAGWRVSCIFINWYQDYKNGTL